ncbi:hypothetical protein DLD82_14270 [Methanospirillum stamsii]|uniref:Uncharacterized protein n=1 Tax=Methanospirillum stamsii TaxID=1277351 RepID=A0A2V2N714_9EURY|nr:hypothetical protein DLD82_14270 [Methanospirillum stamsii]
MGSSFSLIIQNLSGVFYLKIKMLTSHNPETCQMKINEFRYETSVTYKAPHNLLISGGSIS